MRILKFLAIPVVAETLAAGPASAEVIVTFLHSEQYTDAAMNHDRAWTLDTLGSYMRRVGGRDVRPGQTLKITVLDINLSGQYEPWRFGASDVRFKRGDTWPRIKLRYVLESHGKTEASGEELVSDQTYLATPGMATSSDPFKFEKNMLDGWFRSRFPRRSMY